MEGSLPLHLCKVPKLSITTNMVHATLHSLAIAFLIYYRVSFIFHKPKTDKDTPIFPWLLVFGAELLLSFVWLLGRVYYWHPVHRTVFLERLPEDDKLPAIDVFICTADPEKEPTVAVMNTVLSAMALDYPADKLNVYLSDDGGSAITLHGMREAWRFAKWWLPFCWKYGIKTSCPEAYFSTSRDGITGPGIAEFISERQMIKEKYKEFEESVLSFRESTKLGDEIKTTRRDHPAVIEVCSIENEQVELPLLVYVCREKRTSHLHNFKAGALNVLLRVSGMISNSPYILGLDCDMYCNDPTSARQAMCFHLDPKISSSLSFVQFPHRFHNISKNDIYDSQNRSAFGILWQGFDGLRGPVLSGSCYYIKRVSFYGSPLKEGAELKELRNLFGSSNQFIKSLHKNHKPNLTNDGSFSNTLITETECLASCNYERQTKWGKEVGFLYQSVCEDVFTGFISHCRGWISVYLNPSRPQFLGTSVTSLNDLLTQGTRWSAGLLQIAFSRFCPLLYGPSLRISFLQSILYGELVSFPLFYCLSLPCLATIPQLCLLHGIPLYPEASSWFFLVFLFIFLSALAKHLHEVLITGGSIQTWRNEQRVWMIKSVTSHVYGSIEAIMKSLGLREASFSPTNKVADDELVKRYQMGIFDFQTSIMFLAPLVTVAILNMAAFVGGVLRMIVLGDWNNMLGQVLLSFYILAMNYAVIKGMVVRKDEGRIPTSVTRLSAVFSAIFLTLGSIFLMY